MDELTAHGSLEEHAVPVVGGMRWLEPPDRGLAQPGEVELIRVCLNCGATMGERACKLRCRCGYFLSCSDYY
ncbi:MAG TPA: hypothetical protein VFK38_06460 [Candidatus Limnocylindrales bacterium]|nr:hypothetical protein [Candidatus Limnocylindrales bacterium]